MARKMNRLTVKTVGSLKERGYYADGGGLYLQISQWKTKSWVFRYSIKGKSLSSAGKQISYDMGLGALHTVSLAEARAKTTDCRRLLLSGIDPRVAREAGRAQL